MEREASTEPLRTSFSRNAFLSLSCPSLPETPRSPPTRRTHRPTARGTRRSGRPRPRAVRPKPSKPSTDGGSFPERTFWSSVAARDGTRASWHAWVPTLRLRTGRRRCLPRRSASRERTRRIAPALQATRPTRALRLRPGASVSFVSCFRLPRACASTRPRPFGPWARRSPSTSSLRRAFFSTSTRRNSTRRRPSSRRSRAKKGSCSSASRRSIPGTDLPPGGFTPTFPPHTTRRFSSVSGFRSWRCPTRSKRARKQRPPSGARWYFCARRDAFGRERAFSGSSNRIRRRPPTSSHF